MMNDPSHPTENVLWSASPVSSAGAWVGLHDQVMGGRSQGNAQPQAGDGSEPQHMLFSGQISTDNGGGFASYRLRLSAPVMIGEARAMTITLRGDGGPFKLCLHRQNDWDGVQWQADLATPSNWTTQTLPMSAFVARRRGREVNERPFSAGDALFQIGLMTTRPEPGPFWLAVAGIALG